jgi:hypothetical protein
MPPPHLPKGEWRNATTPKMIADAIAQVLTAR